MTLEAITLLYENELRLLEGWIHYRDMTKNVQGEAGELKRQATEKRITECNARLAELETMKATRSKEQGGKSADNNA